MIMEKGNGATIDVLDVTKTYGSFKAVNDINLHIEAGEFMSFLGPSGSGKTTTLNLIAGFTDITKGEIKIGGNAVQHLPAHKRNIGVVFQHYALFPHMTVLKNVMYPLALRKIPKEKREKIAKNVLAMVKLESFIDRYPSELSGGQQQRVALARSIVFDPPLLLMDEPLGALDKKLREWLQLEIKRIHRDLGTTFVYVTHDQEEALALSDRIAVFNHGRIEQIGTGRQLYEQPSTLFVGKFIGESSVIKGKAIRSGDRSAVDYQGNTVFAPGAIDNADAAILVRPEKIAVSRNKLTDPSLNTLAGRITERLYLGSGIKYEIELQDGTLVTSRVGLTDEIIEIGSNIFISWPIDEGRLLVDDEHLNTSST